MSIKVIAEGSAGGVEVPFEYVKALSVDWEIDELCARFTLNTSISGNIQPGQRIKMQVEERNKTWPLIDGWVGPIQLQYSTSSSTKDGIRGHHTGSGVAKSPSGTGKRVCRS
jgi:hypothetical protein